MKRKSLQLFLLLGFGLSFCLHSPVFYAVSENTETKQEERNVDMDEAKEKVSFVQKEQSKATIGFGKKTKNVIKQEVISEKKDHFYLPQTGEKMTVLVIMLGLVAIGLAVLLNGKNKRRHEESN